MKIPKEIADKVESYQELQEQADRLYKEIREYFEKELEFDGFEKPFIADKPHGQEVSDGEYCSQTTLGEDWYVGKYYYPVENSDKYVGISYEI